MLSRLLRAPGALSSTRLAVAVGLAVFVLLLLLPTLLGQLGVDPRSFTATLLVSAAMAMAVGGGVYGLIRAPLERAHESQVAGLATRAGQNERVTSDALTGLLNRHGITASLLEAMAHAERYGNPLSVALVHVDESARVRQELGRKAGDKLLRSVAEMFAEALRLPDRVGRYDNDEFLVVLPQAALKDAGAIAERIRTSAAGMQASSAGKTLTTTLSIGMGRFRKAEDLEHLLSRIGRALQEARLAGGNRAVSAK